MHQGFGRMDVFPQVIQSNPDLPRAMSRGVGGYGSGNARSGLFFFDRGGKT